jgi:hypothetical protein
MHRMNTHAASPRVFGTHRVLRFDILLPLALSVGTLFSVGISAQSPAESTPQTTLIIFADKPMHDAQWSSLFSAFRRGQTILAASTPGLSGEIDLKRGDQLTPGLQVKSPIVVHLHGSCTLLPRPRYVVVGPIGWVPRVKGHIQPFVNVDCDRIVAMLGPLALAMNHNRRNTVMGEAIARVILHEWIHFSTQSAAHSDHGVSKSEFTVADLLADDTTTQNRARLRNSHKEPTL